MITATKIIGTGKSATSRRWLTAAMGAAAVISASAILTASPARADTVQQVCNTFHSWTECISFDYSNGNLAVNALNGYSVTETESLWISVNGSIIATQGFDIPPGSWRGFPYYWGRNKPSDQVCGGIDSVTVVCTVF